MPLAVSLGATSIPSGDSEGLWRRAVAGSDAPLSPSSHHTGSGARVLRPPATPLRLPGLAVRERTHAFQKV